ncbi:30S ribosomal protein S17 [Microcoleus sp. FACHB-1515]|uniref:30S ribosomal protein S17 n=1 Tax=Cyanophyceae TaxID=3028117 RepID=UPI001684ABFE|nr:30S ribosomal protein S17 [Microcoleus sp. FACHB-1515]MBD2091162.1 30S ribosomal protein S17 [Microcoleus sp. FACHB-1515]
MAVKERVGVVVSDKMDKTVVVAIENRAPHPKYKKIMVRTERYKVHDEENACKTGDRVRIQETRPLSRHKRWQVIENLTNPSTPSQETTASQETEA